MLFIDEIGQVPEELLYVIDIILRIIRDIQVVFGRILLIGKIDYAQLHTIKVTPFLL